MVSLILMKRKDKDNLYKKLTELQRKRGVLKVY